MLELVIFLAFAAMFLGPCLMATRVAVGEREDEDELSLQPSCLPE